MYFASIIKYYFRIQINKIYFKHANIPIPTGKEKKTSNSRANENSTEKTIRCGHIFSFSLLDSGCSYFALGSLTGRIPL